MKYLISNKKKLNLRGLISLSVFWSFIIEFISGLVLYIAPTGSVSRWTNLKVIGLNHSDWVKLHTIFGYVFLFFAFIHIIYNWKPIVSYLQRKIHGGMRLRKEMIISVLLCSVLSAGIIFNLAPFQAVLDLGDTIRQSWPGASSEPIASHAERLTFEEFILEANVEIREAIKKMENVGYRLESKEILISEIMKEYDLAPIDIHRIITQETIKAE
jgi:hypothetical protein